ncbi:uncharacterized protein MONOS_3986 [Monocercomonoides exilis]|uniref:uncharacterized protein n=1 Tax=Monocercomonoides exilis TaxID=2049356 RepID=UPI00355A3372|nr:hypothetical protein MONOS_3986 [Monocercomonoides exilis]|eukprot:MONOS_3986.1-p1 / transcript=MONOS_3986.1 / gene=MONOS_3986 / organism=Monocercomonoides_exilis_PA203 / gene_product=unspecified product / transcript_product=unspecified product / location=Mono_scaffold00100:23459-23856(-) / protein_length=113 / sequence_SO=supercontig / SO=protein_coding / is_pseudo=false
MKCWKEEDDAWNAQEIAIGPNKVPGWSSLLIEHETLKKEQRQSVVMLCERERQEAVKGTSAQEKAFRVEQTLASFLESLEKTVVHLPSALTIAQSEDNSCNNNNDDDGDESS